MKAMILAAGLGTRLRPLTLERAKPAAPILGVPLVLRLIAWLQSQGVNCFRLNLHHLPNSVTQLFPPPEGADTGVSFSFEPEILGTAGGLKNNEAFFDSGTFLMVNGDIVTDFSLAEALAFHRKEGALATLLLSRQTPPYIHYPVRIDADGRLVGFKGHGKETRTPLPATYVFTGAHILEPEIFSYIPSGMFFDINDRAYPAAMDDGRVVRGFPVDGYWNDVGTPASYLRANFDMLEASGNPHGSFTPRSAKIAEGAKIGPRAVLGDECVVEDGAGVEDAVLWERTTVRAGVRVRGCLVGAGVTLTSDADSRVITLHGEAPIE